MCLALASGSPEQIHACNRQIPMHYEKVQHTRILDIYGHSMLHEEPGNGHGRKVNCCRLFVEFFDIIKEGEDEFYLVVYMSVCISIKYVWKRILIRF